MYRHLSQCPRHLNTLEQVVLVAVVGEKRMVSLPGQISMPGEHHFIVS